MKFNIEINGLVVNRLTRWFKFRKLFLVSTLRYIVISALSMVNLPSVVGSISLLTSIWIM